MRCYNCGEFANHIASECAIGPQPKRCHRCRSEDHLHADCPHRNASVVSSRKYTTPTASGWLVHFTLSTDTNQPAKQKRCQRWGSWSSCCRRGDSLAVTMGSHLKLKTFKNYLHLPTKRTKRMESKKYLTYNQELSISAVILVCKTRLKATQ